LDIPRLEADLGMEVYASESPGIGGRIRYLSQDFRVQEILTDGSRATFQPDVLQVTGWGRYLLCVLVKENWDTLVAIGKVAGCLGIDPDLIQIAGIKDANAVTAQHITLSRVPPEKVYGIEIRGVVIRPLRFVDQKLSPHLLFGNSFQIRLRNLEIDSQTMRRRIARIKDEIECFGGVPNFFGHQRFGTTRSITHLVGRYIVKRDFENAALAFLSKSSEFERSDSREARQYLSETHDFKGGLARFPRRLLYERLMLMHLAKHPRDYLGALHALPSKVCKLFVQAYQSLLFNRFLSERLENGFRLNKPEIGDYVVDLDELGLPSERCYSVTADNISAVKRKIGEGRAVIAIPLMGYKQLPSQGTQGMIEETILEKEGVKPSDFHIFEMPRAGSKGGLRPVLTPLLDFHSEELCQDPLNPGRLLVELGFTLHRGSYATVVLREFMKPRNVIEAGF